MAKYVEVNDGEVNTVSLELIRSRAKWMLQGRWGVSLGTLYAVNGKWLQEVSYYLVNTKRDSITNELFLNYAIRNTTGSKFFDYDEFTVVLDTRYDHV